MNSTEKVSSRTLFVWGVVAGRDDGEENTAV